MGGALAASAFLLGVAVLSGSGAPPGTEREIGDGNEGHLFGVPAQSLASSGGRHLQQGSCATLTTSMRYRHGVSELWQP